MGKDVRKLIKEINKGRNPEENLPVYIKLLQKVDLNMAALRLSMDYETLFEQMIEGDGISQEARDTFIKVEGYLPKILERGGSLDSLINELKEERSLTREKMDALIACADRLINTEYVYNRMELNFSNRESEDISVSEFAGRIVQFIFATSDNMVINERIKEVLRQLPVRMAKNRFYDLIRDALSLYKGEDEEALDDIKYMLRTSGNLYHSEGMEKYFGGFIAEIEEFENLNYDEMENEDYVKTGERLGALSDKFSLLIDYYDSIVTIVNEMLTVCLMYEGNEISLDDKTEYILKKECELLSFKKYMESPKDVENATDLVIEQFSAVEGIQEELMEKLVLLEAVLDSAVIAGEELAAGAPGIQENKEIIKMLNSLLISQRLMSSSNFADIDNLMPEAALPENKLSEDRLNEKTGELISEFEAYFKGHDRKLNRAVMANILGCLPVFFQTMEEVREYVELSLSQCRDESERKISMELIESLIAETEIL